MAVSTGNLSGTERAWSAAIGTALSMLVFRRSGPVLRSLAALAGAGLLARAAAGHCAVKAALSGESSIGDGLRDQWKRMSGARTDSFDAQEAVEERAHPTAVEEGLGTTESVRPSV